MPPGAMYIRCDTLKVRTRPNPAGGKGWQMMHAEGRAFVASPEFSGQANTVDYDEEKDTVTFDGGRGGTAILWKQDIKGQKAQKVQGEKIIYSRKTGNHAVEKADSIEGH